MTKLDNIVARLLEEQGGGTNYFNAFDAEMQKPENFDIIQELIEPIRSDNLILTGGFGKYIIQKHIKLNLSGQIALFTGRLRTGNTPLLLFSLCNASRSDFFTGSKGEYTFLDDSFYSGKTFNAINDLMLDKYQKRINKLRFVYDGAMNKETIVTSLYRYYDHNK